MTEQSAWMPKPSALWFKLRVLRFFLQSALEDWQANVWRKDLDALYCCDGGDCCCGGDTIRELWTWHVDPPAPHPTTEGVRE